MSVLCPACLLSLLYSLLRDWRRSELARLSSRIKPLLIEAGIFITKMTNNNINSRFAWRSGNRVTMSATPATQGTTAMNLAMLSSWSPLDIAQRAGKPRYVRTCYAFYLEETSRVKQDSG